MKNLILSFILKPNRQDSELQRDIFAGVPLEYEVTDKELNNSEWFILLNDMLKN